VSWNDAELKSSKQTNTSAQYSFSNMRQKPIEIYVFIEPLCLESWSLEPYLKKLSIEFGRFLSIRPIISGHLSTLNKEPFDRPRRLYNIWVKTAKRTGMACDLGTKNPVLSPWITSLAIKSAELQGKNRGRIFLRKVQEHLFLKNENISDETILLHCAKEAKLDIEEFQNDLYSHTAKRALQCDLKLTNEMKVDYTPTIVFFNHFSDEQGIKISGLYPYDIYVLVLSKILKKKPIPSVKPSLHTFMAKHQIVTTKEISVVYDWTMAKAEFEMKKLQLKRIVEQVHVKYGTFWTYIKDTSFKI